MVHVDIDAGAVEGPLDAWRQAVGQGGINSHPLPDCVVAGTRKLNPRLIRIFIQEFFSVYPERGRFDWSRLDPYMDALACTGARVVAALTTKPRPLFPEINASCWRPRDIGEWQQVVRKLVHRYSVEKPIVTYWEIGNEPDIGEDGGSPYRIVDPQDYGDYYSFTSRAILEAFPQAKVGGPANAGLLNEPLPGLIRYCRQTGARLDFLSWHLYHSDPDLHAYQVAVARRLAADLPHQPELMVTEWSAGFPGVSFAEQANDARRAASVAATALATRRAGLDAAFYYHLWDQVCDPEDFAPFFTEKGVANMVRHWNERPHRFGLFGVGGEVRPQYFVFQMLSRLGETQVAAVSDDRSVRVLAGRTAGNLAAIAVNYSIDESRDRVAAFRFAGLRSGLRQIAVYRIDRHCRWSSEELELLPVERRETFAPANFSCQVLLPANTVTLVRLASPIDNSSPR